MLDRVMLQRDLLAIVDELGRTRRIVGPVRRQDRYFYDIVERAAQLSLDFDQTVYSPKGYLFPPTETLFEFEYHSGRFKAKSSTEAPLTALVGVHPCDLHALGLLDRVFERDHRDDHYLRRRQNTFIVAVDCSHPCRDETFCFDMKTHHAEKTFDIMAYPLGGAPVSDGFRWGIVLGTAQGREIIHGSRVGAAPVAEDERALRKYLDQKEEAFSKRIPGDVESLPDLLDRSFDSLIWEATAKRCYSCGSCNLVCPTCYCFNIRDESSLDGQSGSRLREWDGCQLNDFAVVAGDHNFRPKPAARLRHRIFRKGKWIREITGLAGCVGCARCDQACTARISIAEIFTQLAEEN